MSLFNSILTLKSCRGFLNIIIVLGALNSFAQPFTDVLNINHQYMKTKTANDSFSNTYYNTLLGILLPIKIDSSNYLIVRINGEINKSRLSGNGTDAGVNVKMLLFSLGWRHSFNKKFNLTALVHPKLTSDFVDKVNSNDFQMGATLLAQYKIRKNYRYKVGLYYNREPFGNFIIPLLGADVQLNKKN